MRPISKNTTKSGPKIDFAVLVGVFHSFQFYHRDFRSAARVQTFHNSLEKPFSSGGIFSLLAAGPKLLLSRI